MQNKSAYNALMELDNLRIFIEVMSQRSFAAVARGYNVAPSSISRSIAALESELNLRLFQRTTRKLEPTEAGLVYYERIQPLLEELENARQMASDLAEEPKGTLRITAPVISGEIGLVSLLPELANTYPDLSVEFLMTDANLDLLAERIDIAVRFGSLPDSSFIAQCLHRIEFVICASPAYLQQHGTPSRPEDIHQHACLIFPREGFSNNWLFREKNGALTEIPVKGRYLITNSHAIKQSAIAGMGLALLPDMLAKKEIADGSLLRLFSDYAVSATDFDTSIWLLYPSREYLPLKVRVFIEFLKERLTI